MDQLQRLARLDWSQAAHGINASGDERYLGIYRFVRLQRQELERQLRADLLPLAAVPVLAPDRLAIGAQVRINSTCGTVYDADNYLCALDLQLADSGSALDPGLAAGLMEGGRAADAAVRRSDAPVRRRDRWLKQELDALNGRIDRLDQRKELWALRDRMDDIEDRMTGLEIGLRDAQQAAAQPGDNPSASLALLTGRNLLIRFDRNSVRLEPDQQLLLNEVFEQLARAPQNKVLITGYTDRSGDAARNLWLSEQRAKAVRGYLMARGIGAERLLVNFYGDSRSLGRDPAERRVEIEWIR
jgi:outer membrane protein OmpA-like peptidoglycan-associated protein